LNRAFYFPSSLIDFRVAGLLGFTVDSFIEIVYIVVSIEQTHTWYIFRHKGVVLK
jgi:hypothetical protein